MARISRRAYAEMFGPTVGDRLRLDAAADSVVVLRLAYRRLAALRVPRSMPTEE